ncbi:oxygen-independent coproporphyrinogen III oxidase [Palleronia abyssalis]|uniref:Coproporphyrinogen-III oxidase n=1 Tax=Palleronia abyssalis TaxID=1501240 RepID=A0A2R8BY82_9RHOB|nr:oxygen-independent coproporphyrinogen III oxidase [Palleronia abyssalis]SPJ25036.1 Oxygen-independent coproporphyrinogen III oxidase [Palleronia abyssalis]
MTQIDRLRRYGLFDARVPRYTSYPTAPVFAPEISAGFQEACLLTLDPSKPVSVYMHLPFCERLCWFCACHTQGTKSLSPVEGYVDAIAAELSLLADTRPDGTQMGMLHWGGGTPTILPPALIHKVAQAIQAVLPPSPQFEFSVETDPTMIDAAKVEALRACGMTRASIGIQDFAPEVQAAIGRPQSFGVTRRCVDMLRAAGVGSINADLVYGLPFQTAERFRTTVRRVLELAPDRIALFGYAHVPKISKRQRLIPTSALPGDEMRYTLSQEARGIFEQEGYVAVGIDHFAKPGDALARAATQGSLRRNFQGYTTDECETLIGLGASSISRFSQGYVQNASATSAYMKRISECQFAGARGYAFTQDDRLRGHVIERIMCDFRLDFSLLRTAFGEAAEALMPIHTQIARDFDGMVDLTPDRLTLRPEGTPLARLIAQRYDAHDPVGAQFSKAS